MTKQSKRRYTRWALIVGNIALLIGVGIFVLTNRTASQTVRTSTASSISTTSSSLPNPLDQLSADQIAYQAAQMTKLPELTIARNRADSSVALLAVVSNDATTLAKPQVVGTAQKSRLDIVFYKVNRHDTLDDLARRFHVSSSSIRWSNNLDGDKLPAAGHTVVIPPGEGLVYKVTTTDTIDSIVNRYQTNKNTFITVNDAEGNNLRVGEYVWIPNAVQPATPVATLAFQAFTFDITRAGAYYYTGPCESNGYDCGWCTWWAAHRYNQTHSSNLPTNLGDAYSWGYPPAEDHLTVSFRPRAGAALVFPGRNHVGFVESVKSNGDIVISEMNAVGWNTVSSSVIPASQAGNYKYIY